MKALHLARAFGASFALVMAGAVTVLAINNLPDPSVTGPSLGDIGGSNLSSVVKALQGGTFWSYQPNLSVDQTAGQTNCTQLTPGIGVFNITTSASTGYICLPPATGGRNVMIGNGSGQTVDIYTLTPSIRPAGDTINGTLGSTAYTALTNGLNAECFSPAPGYWFCTSGS